jgi:NADPH-dependent F420 reductase
MNERAIPTAGDCDIGILGTGRMGTRLAAMFARAGRKVILGSRDEERAAKAARETGLAGIVPGTYAEAVQAQSLLPAIFIRDGLFEILDEYQAALRDKLLIDISNPFNEDYSDFTTPWNTSGAEELKRRVPHARVVGAYKNVFWGVFDAPSFDGVVSDVLITGDDQQAKKEFLALAAGTPFRYLDAGPLQQSRTVERLTLLTGRLGRQIAAYPRMNWRLLGAPLAA